MGDTYCFLLVWTLSGKLKGPRTVSVERVDSAPVDPCRFEDEFGSVLRRVMLPDFSYIRPPPSPWETRARTTIGEGEGKGREGRGGEGRGWMVHG
jgi:hypothetical protein